jgi:hypothetical protein
MLPSRAGLFTDGDVCWPCLNKYVDQRQAPLAVWIRHLLIRMEEEFNVRAFATSKEDR